MPDSKPEGEIARRVRIFNEAFDIALRLAAEDARLTPSMLADAIKACARAGQANPESIAQAAVESARAVLNANP